MVHHIFLSKLNINKRKNIKIQNLIPVGMFMKGQVPKTTTNLGREKYTAHFIHFSLLDFHIDPLKTTKNNK